MIKETIIEMKKRHWKEEEQLRKDCLHPIKSLIKKEDHSCVGRGSCYSRKDIVCKLCGTKKIIFDRPNWKGIKKTIKKQGFKDERISTISYTHELEER